MYGLVNRDSLPTQKSRWNPIDNSGSNNSGSNNSNNSNTNKSTTSGPLYVDIKPNPDILVNKEVDKLKEKQLNKVLEYIETQNKILTGIQNRLVRLEQREYQELHERITTLEQYNIHERLQGLENLLENSQGDHPILSRKFIPFFINENHVGRDNITNLMGSSLEIIIEILNYQPSQDISPVIFPFGKETSLPKFQTMKLEFMYVDTEANGTIIGNFKQNSDGIYVVELQNFDTNYSFPLMVTCKTELLVTDFNSI